MPVDTSQVVGHTVLKAVRNRAQNHVDYLLGYKNEASFRKFRIE